MGHGKPGKSWNFTISFSRPGKSLKITENDFSVNDKARNALNDVHFHIILKTTSQS